MANERLFKVYNPETRELRDATYDQAVRLKAAGFKTGEDAERAFYTDGPAGLITAAVTGGAGGASLGVTDVLKEYLPDSVKQFINASEDAHPYAHGAGELGGGLVGLGKLNAVGKAAGLGTKALAASNVAASAVQGGLQAWSNDARQNDGFNVEHIASGAGYGSLWGIGGELGGRALSKLHGLAQGPANWLSDKAKKWSLVEINEAGTKKRAMQALAEEARKAEAAGITMTQPPLDVPQASLAKAAASPDSIFGGLESFPANRNRESKEAWFNLRKMELARDVDNSLPSVVDDPELMRRKILRKIPAHDFWQTTEGAAYKQVLDLKKKGVAANVTDLGVKDWRVDYDKPLGNLAHSFPDEAKTALQGDNPFSAETYVSPKNQAKTTKAAEESARKAAQVTQDEATRSAVIDELGPVYKASKPGVVGSILGTLTLAATGGLGIGAIAKKFGYEELGHTIGDAANATLTAQQIKYRYGLGRALLSELASNDVARNKWFERTLAPNLERYGNHLNTFLRSTGSVTALKPMSGREIDRAYAAISDGAQRLSDNPQAIDEHYQAQLGPLTQDNPQMHGQLVTKAGQVVQAVKATIPQNPLPPSALNPPYDPPRSAKLRTVQMYQALNNPVQTLLSNPTPEQQAAITQNYPEISKDLNEQLLTAVQNGTIKKWPRAKQAQLSRLLGGAMRPQDNAGYIARAQASIVGANAAQQANSSGQGMQAPKPLSSTVAQNSAKLVAPGTQQNQLEDAL